MKPLFAKITAGILIAFALLTLFLSSSVIFDLFGIRAKEGNYVLFVVWANFLCSLLYLFAGWKLFLQDRVATWVLGTGVAVLLIALGGLMIHISNGGIYEVKTVKAMIFRSILTAVFTFLSYKLSDNTKNKQS